MPSEPGIAAVQGGWYAKSEGREFYALEWVVAGRWQDRYTLWVGHQVITALGTAVGNHFRATATRFGGSAVVRARDGRTLSALYEGYRAGTGHARYDPESPHRAGRAPSRADLEGPAANTFALRHLLNGTESARWLQAGFSAVRVGDRRARAINAGAGISRPLLPGVTGTAEATATLQTTSGLRFDAGGALKAHLRAELTYRPAPWAALHLGGDYFPTAVPFAGTALTGFSSFNLYEPEALILGRLRTKNTLFANTSLTLAWRW